MKFCQEHWDKLRESIKERGLDGFVAKSGEQAAEQMSDQVKGVNDPTAPYDPLMGCHWAIVNRLADVSNPESRLWVLVGDHCPLCTIEKETANCKCGVASHAQQWIDSVTEFTRDEFIEKGWLKPIATQ